MSLVEGRQTSEAYKNFINSVDSPVSRICYRHGLAYFMKFVNIENEEYDKLLQIDVKKLEGYIRDYIIHMKQDKKLSSATISAYLAAVTHFYEMNDIILRWKKLLKFKGKMRRVVEDKPYSREQIKQLLDRADLREKCIVLLMCSAGLRRGAIPSLKLKDLDEINQHDVYKITVYKKEQEQYTTFCTPECRKYISQYLAWRSRLGEKLQPNSPIIRQEFDSMSPMKATRPKTISEHTISYLINNLLDKTGVRPRMANGGKRTELMQTHGFRKFFETTCITNGMNESYVESVMGHKNGLKNAYFKPTDDQILEGNDKTIGFVGAMPFLTINPTDEENERLRKQVRELTPKSDEIQAMKAELKEFKEYSAKLGLVLDELRATVHSPSKADEKRNGKRRRRKEI